MARKNFRSIGLFMFCLPRESEGRAAPQGSGSVQQKAGLCPVTRWGGTPSPDPCGTTAPKNLPRSPRQATRTIRGGAGSTAPCRGSLRGEQPLRAQACAAESRALPCYPLGRDALPRPLRYDSTKELASLSLPSHPNYTRGCREHCSLPGESEGQAAPQGSGLWLDHRQGQMVSFSLVFLP